MSTCTSSDPITSWRTYIDQLAWSKVSLDDVGNRAFLRVGSGRIPEQIAFDEASQTISQRKRHW
jgi:hypothetical protein